MPLKQTEIILSFLRLHPSTAFWTLAENGECINAHSTQLSFSLHCSIPYRYKDAPPETPPRSLRQHFKQMLMPVMLSDATSVHEDSSGKNTGVDCHASSLEVQNGLFHSGNQDKFRGHT